MRIIFILFFISLSIQAIGQKVPKLERELQKTSISDLIKIRKIANAIYKMDPFNEMATYYLVSSYNFNHYTDSVPILFAKLKRENPNSPKPYILSAIIQYQNYSLKDSSRLLELHKAYKLDSNNIEVLSLLGSTYYEFFNKQPNRYHALQSRLYFLKAIQLQRSALCTLKYPIIQTSYYLQDTAGIAIFRNYSSDLRSDSVLVPQQFAWYFPFSSFLGLKKNWEKEFSVNVERECYSSAFHLNWYSEHLFALKEPILYHLQHKTSYRFTWLRSFNKPVAIRLEKVDSTYTLYWKKSNGAGGYGPGKLVVNRSKKLTKEQWKEFNTLLQECNYWSMPTMSENEFGTDGSHWILEGLEEGKYHVVDRWSPSNSNYQKCCLYLIKLTGLKEDVY